MDENLTEEVEILGEWFLPNSEKKSPGIFRYKNGQSTLELLRQLEIKSSASTPNSIEIIYGDTKNGPATLTAAHFTFTYASIYTATFGAHLDKNRTVHGIEFGLDILKEWAPSSHPRNSLSPNSTLDPPEKHEAKLGDITSELLVSQGVSINNIEGSHRVYLNNSFLLKSERGIDLHELIDYVNCIQFFLTIVTGRNTNLQFIRHLAEQTTHRCDIFIPVDKKESQGSQHKHFFNLPYIKNDYEKIIAGWFDFYQKNKYLLRLFLSTIKNDVVEPMDFFIYASILDGYYKFSNASEPELATNVAPKRKYRHGSLLFSDNTCNRQYRSSYKDHVTRVLEPFRSDFTNLDDFISKVSQMRHDHLHFNRRDKIDEELLSKITHDLYFLLRIIFLRHIGVDKNRVLRIKDPLFLQFNQDT